MRLFFISGITALILYTGYVILAEHPVFGPYVREYSTSIKQKILPNDQIRKDFSVYQAHCAFLPVFPLPSDSVSVPFTFQVIIDNSKSDCLWKVFEGQGGAVELYSKNNDILFSGHLVAISEWMTSLPVTYQVEVTHAKMTTFYDNSLDTKKTYSGQAVIRITEEDPSGEDEQSVVEIPITLIP